MVFNLTWYGKDDEELVGERYLKGVTVDDIRALYGLAADEYPGDCLMISTWDQTIWARRQAPEVYLIPNFEYFIESCQSIVA